MSGFWSVFEDYAASTRTVSHALRGDPADEFCVHDSDGGPCVSGRFLQRPWHDFRHDPVVEFDVDGRVALISRTSWCHFSIGFAGEPPRMSMGPGGARNDVVLSLQPDRRVIGTFPSVGRWVEMDLTNASEPDRLLVLLVVGSGLPRRARRGGILVGSQLPSRGIS